MLYRRSGIQATDIGSRVGRAEDLGPSHMCVLHVALDYFCCALLPQSFGYHMIMFSQFPLVISFQDALFLCSYNQIVLPLQSSRVW